VKAALERERHHSMKGGRRVIDFYVDPPADTAGDLGVATARRLLRERGSGVQW